MTGEVSDCSSHRERRVFRIKNGKIQTMSEVIAMVEWGVNLDSVWPSASLLRVASLCLLVPVVIFDVMMDDR